MNIYFGIFLGLMIIMITGLFRSTNQMGRDSKRSFEQFEKIHKESIRHNKAMEKNVEKYLETYKDELVKKIRQSNVDIKGLLSIKGDLDG